MDINKVVEDVKSAIESIYNENYPEIKDMTEKYFDASKLRLEMLLIDTASGQLSIKFFNKRIGEEQAILESQLLSFKVVGISIAKEAAEKAIQIIIDALNS